MPTKINGDDFRLDPRWRGIAKWSSDRTTRVYEPKLWRVLAECVRPNDIVVDVGANIGLYAVAFARRVGKGRVYAVEPDAANVRSLRFHIRVNGVEDRVEIVQAAVGDRDGTVEFAARGSIGSSVAGIWSGDWEEGGTETVRQVRLSTAFDHIDVLKLDVEGYEGQALAGATELLQEPRRRPRCIFLEAHPQLLPQAGWTVEGLEALLRGHGYRIEPLVTEHYLTLHWWATL